MSQEADGSHETDGTTPASSAQANRVEHALTPELATALGEEVADAKEASPGLPTEGVLSESGLDETGLSEAESAAAEGVSGLLRYALPSVAAIGSIGALEFLRQRFQHSHMFEPTQYPEGDWQPGESGLDVEDVYFKSEDGTGLHGWWIKGPRQTPSKEPMTVIYCHGNSGSIADRVEIFLHLRRLDIDIFAFDYRGFGRSEGSPSEDGVCADVRAAIDYVTGELDVPFERVILFGHSLGGAIAIDGAMNRPKVAGLVVQSSFTQTVDMAKHFYPDLPVHLIATNKFRSIEKVGQLPMPKLFIHGGADKKVPFHHGEALFEAAAEPKSWLPIARADHSDVHQWGGLRYFSRLVRFRREARAFGEGRLASESAAPASSDS